ncbi:alkaline phosphatase D family protein [Kribbella sp. C-35]|uniref:alkaline phosphatase D family protein n=1 Tax=Kribbella sp. C-35 TaxID=2789276 RepID=UPI003978FEED
MSERVVLPSIRRRTLLGAAGAAVAAGGVVDVRQAHANPIRSDPFGLGVASGDPLPDRVILWTRLLRDPADGALLTDRAVQVGWQVATDERFRHVVRAGSATARPNLAHSIHVDAAGLRPGRDYFYRFRTGRFISPVGRTRTAPAAGSAVARLRFAVANCQDWQNGYFGAYRDIAASDLDLVLHVGDYIYEYDPQQDAVRPHNASSGTAAGANQLITLADYRNRHALYKSDPALQAAHAALPFISTWDDHETENNYAGLVDEQDAPPWHQTPEQFKLQRAAAYQAWYEHTPVRATNRSGWSDLRIYRRFDFGTLLRLNVLDTRQYRTDQPGGGLPTGGLPSDFGPQALGDTNVTGTLTGPVQEKWLLDGLRTSHSRWNVLGQQVMMAPTRFLAPPPASVVNLDQWDGYTPQRRRLLAAIAASEVANPVVIAGDIHSTWINDLRLTVDDPSAPVVASEFVSTSITSDFPAAFVPIAEQSNAAFNPWVRYFNGRTHGWLRMDVDRTRWLTEERSVSSVAVPDAPSSTTARWAVEAGKPGVVPA